MILGSSRSSIARPYQKRQERKGYPDRRVLSHRWIICIAFLHRVVVVFVFVVAIVVAVVAIAPKSTASQQ